MVDHECEYPSETRSSLSAVIPPSFDLEPAVFSTTPQPARSSSALVDLTGPDDIVDMGVSIDSESEESATVSTTKDVERLLPSASARPVFDESSDSPFDEESDNGEPMDLESDDDDIFELRHHLAKEPKVRRNLLAELATFVHERLAYSQANGSVGLAKAEQFDFDAALGVCEAFYKRIRSGVYSGIGSGLVFREVDLY